MPYDLEFTIRVTVQSGEEAARMQEAVYSGYAAEIMRIGVLYGQIPVGGAVPMSTAPYIDQTRQEANRRVAAVEIQRVESKQASVEITQEKKERPRPVGVAGRKRLGRA